MFSSISSNRRMFQRSELTDAALASQSPSIFAEQAVEGVSDRYTFIPTGQIISRMRQEGWAPVQAEEQRVRLPGRMGFQKHLVRFQRRDTIAKVGDFATEIALVNSHEAGRFTRH